MDDDFNTPVALSVLFDMVREINRLRNENVQDATALAIELKRLGNVLGILQQSPDEFLQDGMNTHEPKEFEQKVNDLILPPETKPVPKKIGKKPMKFAIN